MTELAKRASVRFTERIDRRRFLRRSAKTTFAGVAAFAAGGGWEMFRATVANATSPHYCESTGPGCPSGYGCGPSPCCNSLRKGCWCAAGTSCSNNRVHCFGNYYGGWGRYHCWSCVHSYHCGYQCCTRTTNCCDCATDSAFCGHNHCIGYYSSVSQYPCTSSPDAPDARIISVDQEVRPGGAEVP